MPAWFPPPPRSNNVFRTIQNGERFVIIRLSIGLVVIKLGFKFVCNKQAQGSLFQSTEIEDLLILFYPEGLLPRVSLDDTE